MTSFLSRVPGIRDVLGLSSVQLGLLLLCLSGGSIVGLPLAGPIVQRFRPARIVLSGSLTRFGPVTVVRMSGLTALAGLLLVLLSGSTVVALARALLWGLGTSLGFPIGMTAAADDPTLAAARVSVVSSIGYTAFLAGPPLIGLLAQTAGILRALFLVSGALALAMLTSNASRPAGLR